MITSYGYGWVSVHPLAGFIKETFELGRLEAVLRDIPERRQPPQQIIVYRAFRREVSSKYAPKTAADRQSRRRPGP